MTPVATSTEAAAKSSPMSAPLGVAPCPGCGGGNRNRAAVPRARMSETVIRRNRRALHPARSPSLPKKTHFGPCCTGCSVGDASLGELRDSSSSMDCVLAPPQYVLAGLPVPSLGDQPRPVQHHFTRLAGAHGRKSLLKIGVV